MLEVTRNELMEERVNNAKYKHFIKTNITMCSQFFSSVINNLNDCIVTTDLDISIPDGYDPDKYLSNEEREQAGPSTRVHPKTSKINELNKLCKNNAKNQDQYLYTINENEMSSLSTTSVEERNDSTEERNESVRQSLRISTPNKSTFPAFQDFQNITYIPAQTSSPPINLPDTNNSTCSNNSSTASSFNINQDTPRKSHKRDSLGRRLSNSEDETLPKKKLSIDISAVSLTEHQLQEYLDKFDSNDIYEDDNESLFSSPSTSSSKFSVATTRDSVTTSKDSVATKKRKPRAKAEPVKRKSNGRPKRKIALNVSLAEKSCRTKLRRSK
ncbi:unnamed protein product [Diamesa hyperborea]